MYAVSATGKKIMSEVSSIQQQSVKHDATDRIAVMTCQKAKEIFHEFHSSAIGGHTGMRRTIENISRYFKWKNMTAI